ncbi:hypothetical protein [Sphingomonas sp. BK580]|uniref:hypothetical protein n=1 Tax=Sphingomonas sp. BK580 TaxID=2586972 RepID=UPI00161AFDE6|nr:hypothetical protein [Sphingomonas sp. BK580]MBB3695838.1 FKBP-type peptidyl-prolyl cis-trans isomerase (trigger factor) [Sphingomonas sp. BK580]
MAKLDWSKGGNYEPDPARVQRTVDFTVPDKLDKKVTFRRKAGLSAAQQAHKEKKAKQRATAQAKQMAKRAAKEAKAAKEAAQRAAWEAERAERRKAALVRIAAEEARKQSPEYIEAQRAEEARLAWIEHERKLELAAEREPLRQRWRRQLLGR